MNWDQMKAITPAELSRRLRAGDPVRLLDVREPDEHALVALPGSRLIPLGELEHRASEITGWVAEEVIVYCHHGVRSAHGAAFLLEYGFQNVANLSGGIDRWSREVDSSLARY